MNFDFLIPVPAAKVAELLKTYDEYVTAHFIKRQERWLARVSPSLTRRRWFGLRAPILDHEPTFEEAVSLQSWSVWCFYILDNHQRWVKTMQKSIEVSPYGGDIWLTDDTVRRLTNYEVDYPPDDTSC